MARSGRSRRGDRTQPVLITSAPATDRDLNRRQTQYLAMMSLRVICFVAAVFLTGAWRWLAVAGAAFLPAIAVVIANAIDLRRKQGGEVPTVTPQPVDLPELEAAREQPLVIPAEPADGAPDDPAPPKAQRPGT